MAVIRGTGARNVLKGTNVRDVMFGLGGNDDLTGLNGNDTIDGGAGVDTMRGGRGNDTYTVDNIRDRAIEAVNQGTDFVRASVTYTLGANVEQLTLTGGAAISGTGNALANTITGNAAANTLSGGGGNDTLNGGGGNDRLAGGAGSDTLNGGAGTDTAVFSGNLADYELAFVSGRLEVAGADGTDNLGSDVEFLEFADQTIANGAPFASVITGDTTGSVTEDGALVATGDLDHTDLDGPDDVFQAFSRPGVLGNYAVDAAGNWTYSLTNSDPTVQALGAGQSTSEIFSVFAEDGTERMVTVTINGTNDAAVITGTATGGVTEDGTLIATGTLSVADIDTGQNEVVPQTGMAGSYGSFSITAAGAWTYTLNNANAAVQALPAGATLTDSFVVASEDGTDTETVVITITGADEPDVDSIDGTVDGVGDLANITAAVGLRLNGRDADDHSGYFVSSAGDINGDGFDDLLVGAYRAEDGAATNEGETYLVFGGAALAALDAADGITDGAAGLANLTVATGLRLIGRDANDFSGRSVSSAGDVNGDGFDDLLIGAYSAEDGAASNEGETYLVFGGAALATLDAADGSTNGSADLANLMADTGLRLIGRDASDRSGNSVTSAGDINGDGFDDLLVGAPSAEDGAAGQEGETYLVFGGAALATLDAADGGTDGSADLANLTAATGLRLIGRDNGDRSGYSVSAAGDVNGDGFDDLLVGADLAEDGAATNEGETYLVFGGAALATLDAADGSTDGAADLANLTAATGLRLIGRDNLDISGFSVSSAGDVNGDGFDDLLIGAWHAEDGAATDEGETYLVFGGAALATLDAADGGTDGAADLANLTAATGLRFIGRDAYDRAGFSVSSAGDVNGDGFDDLLIGAFLAEDGAAGQEGETYLVFGGAALATLDAADGSTNGSADLANLTAATGLRLIGRDAVDRSGRSVSSAGDVNGDGFDDLLIGAYLAEGGAATNEGETYLIYGAPFGADGTPITLSGGAGAEMLLGGLGDDTLSGGGGADVIRSGAGNDTLTIGSSTFFRIDAGNGQDTLVANSFALDLTAISNVAIEGIETIDLTGGGGNALTLSISDLQDLDGSPNAALAASGFSGDLSHNSLVVRGATGDTVTLAASGAGDVGEGGAWTLAGTTSIGANTYGVWNFLDGAALVGTIAIDQDVTVAV